jgi:hypothetical protein
VCEFQREHRNFAGLKQLQLRPAPDTCKLVASMTAIVQAGPIPADVFRKQSDSASARVLMGCGPVLAAPWTCQRVRVFTTRMRTNIGSPLHSTTCSNALTAPAIPADPASPSGAIG